MSFVYLLLGTNLGNKSDNLALAKEKIRQSGLIIINESAIYETAPWGFEHPKSFYNQVISLQTDMATDKLLLIFLNIEKLMGRSRLTGQYEARIIDIDILFYDDVIIQSEFLTIPHPLLQLRRFVLEPLCEIAPTLIHPLLNKTVKELLQECSDKRSVKKLSQDY
jgi:2-amino-4-hydroxy-6-hydroxymethyldihydropteridine diphosphokinase